MKVKAAAKGKAEFFKGNAKVKPWRDLLQKMNSADKIEFNQAKGKIKLISS